MVTIGYICLPARKRPRCHRAHISPVRVRWTGAFARLVGVDMPEGYGRIPRWVADLIPEIGPSAFTVYAILSDHCNGERDCHPSLSTIQQRTGLCRKTVVAALRALEDSRTVQRVGGPNCRLAYHLPIDDERVSLPVSGVVSTPVEKVHRCTQYTDPVEKLHSSGVLVTPPSEQEPRTRTKDKNHTGKSATSTPPPNPVVPDESKPKRTRRVPVPPGSVEEVILYFEGSGSTERDARCFWYHFEQNGWYRAHGLPILKWRAAAGLWIARQPEFASQANAGSNGTGKKQQTPAEIQAQLEGMGM